MYEAKAHYLFILTSTYIYTVWIEDGMCHTCPASYSVSYGIGRPFNTAHLIWLKLHMQIVNL